MKKEPAFFALNVEKEPQFRCGNFFDFVEVVGAFVINRKKNLKNVFVKMERLGIVLTNGKFGPINWKNYSKISLDTASRHRVKANLAFRPIRNNTTTPPA